ncbi:MAG: DUF6111 family protein [Acetobacteraceae bacterium]
MLRFGELALFLSPFILFAVWRLAIARGYPSLSAVTAAACALLVMLGILVWYSREASLPPGETYVPARLENGRVVPGHGAR